MIQITPQMRILISVESVDFRNGIDGLSRICRKEMRSDPFSGYVFLFRNRRKTSIKILMYDGQGFWVCQKRLSKGSFRWWPGETTEKMNYLTASELQTLIWNGDPKEACFASEWKKIIK